ncbi:hypothetical protein [Saccharicrinis fermentans]|uniref:Uncharacterized protein n=1 Tax=Saccharicrinis fermentans DSM 9555 = JCM 21142 TaxID=869213 RepID=W7YKY1_9BACT|nr:hypothetical protein [Saccharicrinis fermentans]GAF03019.1 hypothetical protein JCM21142_41672 [Saccharicrinis fermentans DSM 9555 = JCM 21142]
MKYKSHQGKIHHPSRYTKIPYDLADLERVIVQMPKETCIRTPDLTEENNYNPVLKRKLFKEVNEKRMANIFWY